jgi:hypothetical protein
MRTGLIQTVLARRHAPFLRSHALRAVPPGSDVLVSPAWDTQRGAVPDHLVLTAGGTAGLYVEEPAPKSITSAWMDRDGKLSTVVTEIERELSPPVAAKQSHD